MIIFEESETAVRLARRFEVDDAEPIRGVRKRGSKARPPRGCYRSQQYVGVAYVDMVDAQDHQVCVHVYELRTSTGSDRIMAEYMRNLTRRVLGDLCTLGAIRPASP